MPFIKVKCPLCPEKCSEKNLGKHLTSKAHADVLRKNNEALKAFLQVLKDNSHHPYKNHPPLFTISKIESLHICMTCNKCYKNGDGCIGSAKHYEKSPACKTARIQDLESFLFPKVKANDANNALAEELKKKDADVMRLEKAKIHFMDKCSSEQDKVDRLKKLLSMMCGNDFDADDDDHIDKLENYLNADDGNTGFYMGRLGITQEESD
jgi:hypothetical protein